MSQPGRWIDEGAPEVVRQLLAAAGSEQPSRASLSRTLAALGAGVGAASAAGTAGAATAGVGTAGAAGAAKVSTLASVLVLKGTLFGAGLGAIFVAVNLVAFPERNPSRPALLVSASAPATVNAPSGTVRTPSAPVAPFAPVPEQTEQTEQTANSARPLLPQPRQANTTPEREAPSDAIAPIDAEQLREEVRAVDRASEALAAGQAAAALAALDDYEAHFPRRRLAPEALYLRVEALLRLGRLADARTVAERLVSSYPSSPHAERARQVLSRSIP